MFQCDWCGVHKQEHPMHIDNWHYPVTSLVCAECYPLLQTYPPLERPAKG